MDADAYSKGYAAGIKGAVSYADCPYRTAGDLRESWQIGYSDGRAGLALPSRGPRVGGVEMSDTPAYTHWRRAYVGEMLRLATAVPLTGCLLTPNRRKVVVPGWLKTPTSPARIMWEGTHGTPPGRITRLCQNPRCIAPAHLRSD